MIQPPKYIINPRYDKETELWIALDLRSCIRNNPLYRDVRIQDYTVISREDFHYDGKTIYVYNPLPETLEERLIRR